MTRDDVIKAMAEAMHKDDDHCDASRLMDCEAQEAYSKLAVLSIEAIESLGVRLVPVEPTEEMLKAAWDESDGIPETHVLTWTYMLLASPLNNSDMCQAKTVQGCSSSSETSSPLHSVAQWMPIETAPKDGSLIDAWCVNPYDESDIRPIRLTDISWHEADEIFPHSGWIRVTDDGNFDLVEHPPLGPCGLPAWKPTHWMRRPASPLRPNEERSDGEQPQGKPLA